MDLFFQEEYLHLHLQGQGQGDISWYDIGNPVVNPAAFVPYTSPPQIKVGVQSSSNCKVPNPAGTNMNKRMIEFMRGRWPLKTETHRPDSQQHHRHRMSERLRREKERNGYLALHSMLPIGSKKEKNAIMQMAAKRIQELKTYKEVLERRNDELQERLEAMGNEDAESTKVRIKVANPASGVDLMVGVLECLKSLGSKTRGIQSQVLDQELVAVIDIETEIEAADVEKAVKRTVSRC